MYETHFLDLNPGLRDSLTLTSHFLGSDPAFQHVEITPHLQSVTMWL